LRQPRQPIHQLRAAEQERDKLRLAIARALTLLPGRPEAAEQVLERAMEGKHGK